MAMQPVPLVYLTILSWSGSADILACVTSCLVVRWPRLRVLVAAALAWVQVLTQEDRDYFLTLDRLRS